MLPLTRGLIMPIREARPLQIVVVGASGAAGVTRIKGLLAALPARLPAAILVVLHRPSDLPSELQSVLSRVSPMPVLIAVEGERLREGYCYIGEPAAHLSLGAGDCARLVEGTDHKHRGRTIDILFNSVAEHAAISAVGVVLSGSFDDGSHGSAAIAGKGGKTFVIGSGGIAEPGMPENAAIADCTARVMDSEHEIAREIIRYVAAVHNQDSGSFVA